MTFAGLSMPGLGEAQPADRVARIGFLTIEDDPRTREAFRQELRDRGYVDGRNVLTEYRDAKGQPDEFPAFAAELVALKVDVIVTAGGTRAAMAARQATSTIPIVFTAVGDPVGEGVVTSLAKPGANITGTSLVIQQVDKLLELLKQAVPRVSRVALLYLAAKNRLPSVFSLSDYADAGGLMSYGPDRRDLFRRAAIYVDKILKGARPGDLPVEQPTKFELVINLRTAKALRLTIPEAFRARADRVIDR